VIEPSPHANRWRQLAAPAMLTVTVLIWASNNIATKLVLTEVTAPTVMLVRFTLMTLLFHFPTFLLMRHFGVRLSRGE